MQFIKSRSEGQMTIARHKFQARINQYLKCYELSKCLLDTSYLLLHSYYYIHITYELCLELYHSDCTK